MFELQIASSVLLFLNKYYVLKKKTIGWIFGIWGTVVITVYFYLQMTIDHKINLWIMIVYDCALLFLMIYGYLVASSPNNDNLLKILKKWNLAFKSIVVLVTTVVCIVLLVKTITAQLVVTQFISVVCGLMGTLLLAFNTRSTNGIGWVFYFIAHVLVVYLMLKTDSPWIALGQIFSALIALRGMVNEFKKPKSKAILSKTVN